MSRKPKSSRTCDPKGLLGDTSPMVWNDVVINNNLYSMFLQQIVSLALTRFEWVNLPPGCDERFLEWCLLTQGMATIAFPKKQKGQFYSTQAVQYGRLNIYHNPARWWSYGINGWRFRADNTNGVFIYENKMRTSIWRNIQIYAKELTDIMRTKQINRLHCRVPFIITGPQEQQLAMNTFWQDVVTGSAATLAYPSFLNNVDIKAIQTGVEYLGDELQQDMLNVWNEVYRMLGIPNMPMKMERQIEDEVHNYEAPTETFRLDPLSERQSACRKLNRRFKAYLVNGPISCVFRTDHVSHNHAVSVDIKERMELMR